MLLRNSISNTKKFFSRTIQSFKSFFSGSSYQKMPKTSPYSEINTVRTSFNNKELDNFYNDFSHRWETDTVKPKKGNEKTINPPPKSTSASPAKQAKENELNGSFSKFSKTSPIKAYQIQKTENYKYNNNNNQKNRAMGFQGAGEKRLQESSSKYSIRDEEGSFLVAQKLKELEMMDISNVDHVLDIEEVLHYYSRLTCPAYLDIVDKFFMEMYTEFFSHQPGTPPSVNSRPIRLSSKIRS